MAEKSRKPKIRFTGCTEDWEQRKLEDLFKILPNNTLSRAELGFEKGIFKNLHYGDILIKFNEILDGCDKRIPFINRNINFEKIKNAILKNGDIVIADAAEDETVGKCTELLNVSQGEQIVSGLHTIPCRPNIQFAQGFLGYYMNSNSYHSQLIPLMQGIKVLSLSKSSLQDTLIAFPLKRDEQVRIGTFFRHLDRLITLHQRKCERLVNIKKAMLEKMFPEKGADVPEVRFAGFTEAWKQRKWNETVIISTQMVDPRSGDYDNLPHVAPGNIESFSGRLYDNIKLVKDEDLISGKFYFCAGDVVYGKIRPHLGKYFYASFKGLTSADAYVLKAHNGLDQKFLYTLLQTNDFFSYSVSVSMRSGMPKINRDELNTYCFLAPQEEEQHKIGSVFLTLDHLITLHQRKVNLLHNIKKACLETMFV